jgi:signal peptidase II
MAFLAVAAGGLAADLCSKHYVFRWMLQEPSIPRRVEVAGQNAALAGRQAPSPTDTLRALDLHRNICPGVRFTLSTNPGIVFGLSMPRWLVGIASVAAILLVCIFFCASGARARLFHVGLACVLAGALGNLHDRLFSRVALPGDGAISYQVRDFIDCSGLYYPWVFNVADMLLVAGVATLLLYSFITDLSRRRRA